MLARQAVTLDRSTLSNWVGRACWWLTPPYDLIVGAVLDPGCGRTKTGRLWYYAVDDRPWGGESNTAATYVYSEDHRRARPAEHLASFKGVLQVDGYGGFKRPAGERADQSIRLAFCWAHMRHGFGLAPTADKVWQIRSDRLTRNVEAIAKVVRASSHQARPLRRSD
jgi:transposase